MNSEKERKGYKWVQCGDGGYWSKLVGEKHTHKLPIFCPYEPCSRITGTVDDEHMRKYGCCRLCYAMYVEERKKPLIDVEYYRKRLEERGY